MNKYQRLIQERFLDNEEAVINALKSTYEQSYKDITKKIESLDLSIERLQKAYNDIDGDEIGELAQAFLSKNRKYTPEEARETLQSMLQSKVYQRDYQKALEKQVDGVLSKMLDKEYETISDYLTECYEDGFVGTIFDMQSQGIPLCFPLDQEAIVNAVQLNSPIKEGLYNHLGENVGELKTRIASEVSRGIATGMSYAVIARNIRANMMGTYENPGGSYAYALRIARTEGHRIQCQATMDACFKAKEKGADVVKQWDSTLDGNTRESHQKVDGEIRELDEKFSNGLMFPGDPSGGAAEVVNCRCALLQRARWALDEAELETLKERAEHFGLDKSEQFEDFKKKYLKAAESSNIQKITFESVKLSGIDADYVPDIKETLNGLMTDYPIKGINVKTHSSEEEFGHYIGGVKGVTRKGEQYAVFDNEVSFSKQLHKNRNASIDTHHETYTNNMSALYNAKRTDLATIPHEYGHAIDTAYVLAKDEKMRTYAHKFSTPQKISKSDIEEITDFNIALSKSDSRLSKEIFDELQEEYGLTYGGTIMKIAEEYGTYASSSISEFLAEGFANMRMLDDTQKTDFMKSFEKIFNRKFNEVLGGE